MTEPVCVDTESAQQIAVAFDPHEDRLLMRVALGQREVALWLTRRCVHLLWTALIGLVKAQPHIALQADEGARQALVDLDHARVVASSDFSRPYGGACAPMGPSAQALAQPCGPAEAAAALVSRVDARAIPARSGEASRVELTFQPSSGYALLLEMPLDLVHALAHLLRTAAVSAEWDLCLELPGERQGSADRVLSPDRVRTSRPSH